MNIRQAPHIERINEPDDNFGFAIASLVASMVGLCLLAIPPSGLYGSGIFIAGIILGVKGLRSRRKIMAIAGLVLSILGLITAVVLLFQGVASLG